MTAPNQESDFLPPVGQTIEKLMSTGQNKRAIPSFNTKAPRQDIPVYFLPESSTPRQQKAVMLALTLCGRCDDARPMAWQSWVLTWSTLCFPELVRQFIDDATAVDYSYHALSAEFVQSCVDAVTAQGHESTAGDRFVSMPSSLPNAALIPIDAELASAINIEALYAYYAMIVFIMGKSLSPENVVSISSKRPDALIRKRQLHDYAYILTGAGQIKPDNYKRIQSGWIRSTAHRMTVVKQLARMNASPNRSEILDSVSVNMEMLANSGQTYLFYIHELLIACPWAVSLPALRSSYYYYRRMVDILAEQDDYIRPYYKLMMQDAAKDVRRRNIESLIAVATFFAAQTRKTMNQYRVNEGTVQVIAAFRAEAERRGIHFEEVQNQLTTETTAV